MEIERERSKEGVGEIEEKERKNGQRDREKGDEERERGRERGRKVVR